MAEDTATAKTTKPKEDQSKTLARRINAWGFIVLVGLVLLVFGPIAAYLSWKSNSVEGTNVALKVLFAILAYFGNMFYIIWFAIMKTINASSGSSPTSPDTASSWTNSSSSSSSSSTASPPSPASPAAPASSPASSTFSSLFSSSSKPVPAAAAAAPIVAADATRPAELDDDMFDAVKPDAKPIAQQGGKKKLKLRRRK